ncbi:sodium:solute symporter family protein [Synergistaceae bacterium OttesenSCG-928-I11]|nr:sodium:solute symporter family protein [Synergistaceae bacterium OttesenSCG-928-I11]
MEFIPKPSLMPYVFAYFAVIVLLGFFYGKHVKGAKDFVLAGGALGPIVVGGTLGATWVGGGAISGGSGALGGNYGIWAGWIYVIVLSCSILLIYMFADKLKQRGKFTIPGVLEQAYGKFARYYCGIIVVIACMGIAGTQFTAFGFMLNTVTGFDKTTAVAIGTVVVVIIAMLGGLRSVAPTDLISAVFMVLAMVIVIPMVAGLSGGWGAVMEKGAASGALNFPWGRWNAYGVIAVTASSMFLLLGDQGMLQRVIAAKDNSTMRKGIFIGMLFMILLSGSCATLGFVGRTLWGWDMNASLLLLANATVLPTLIGGMFLAACTAFIVTSGNSYLLSAGTSLVYDIIVPLSGKKFTDDQQVWMSRWLIPVIGLIGFITSLWFPSVLAAQLYAYTLYGATLTPALFAAFLWRRVTRIGGIASMLTGSIATLANEIAKKPFGLESSIIAIPLSIGVLIVVSLLTQGTKSGVVGSVETDGTIDQL